MDGFPKKYLYEIFPEILYTIDRNATSSWSLNDLMNNYNLMLIYDGRAEFTRNNVKVIVSRGDLVFCRPGDLRRAHTFQNNLMKSFAVDFTYTCPIYKDNEWNLTKPDLPFSFVQRIEDENLFSRLFDLFSLLTRAALSTKNKNKVKERTILMEILTHLFQYVEGNQYNYSNMRKVEKVINYMTENYSNNITLNVLSENAMISSSYLGSIFKMVTGKSTIDYLIEIRINKAKSLLRDGYSVSETSKIVGFNDIFYFSKTFKKHEGVSPTQYVQTYNIENSI
jgi:AraC-like DNA-binding protein